MDPAEAGGQSALSIFGTKLKMVLVETFASRSGREDQDP
jgi:hypothetical protein